MQRVHTLLPLSRVETSFPFVESLTRLTSFPEASLSAPLHTQYLSTPTIMVIESSQTTKKIIETCLRSEGYPVISFTDTTEARAWLVQKSLSMPELVLLDSSLSKICRL